MSSAFYMMNRADVSEVFRLIRGATSFSTERLRLMPYLEDFHTVVDRLVSKT